MKKLISFLLFVILFTFHVHAQSGLYGLTRGGNGTISKYDASTSSLTTVYSFQNTGTGPFGSEFIEGIDGKFYSTTGGGGKNNKGVLFSYDPATNSYSSLIDLTSTCTGVFIKGQGSMIYGLTSDYIFTYNTTNATYAVRYNFANEQKNPVDGLTIGADGKFYGISASGGAYDYGFIFSFDTLTNTFTTLFNLDETIGKGNHGLTLGSDNLLYGTASYGVSNYNGRLFSFDPATSTFQVRYNFDGFNGDFPSERMTLASNGKLYGVTLAGEHLGVIYSFDPLTNTYEKIHDFESGAGGRLTQALTFGSDGKLYGVSASLDYVNDILFSLDPLTNAFTILYNFENTGESFIDEEAPIGKLLQASSGKLYGMLSNEYLAKGRIFSFDYASSAYSEPYRFVDFANGRDPYNSLIKANDKLIGMTTAGGGHDAGVIFSFNPTTNRFKKLHDFDSTNGKAPHGNLVQATNGLYYGMTNTGGSNNAGVLFSFNLSTGVFARLFDFDSGNGVNPTGSLIQADNGKLYGMTNKGGANNLGVIFSFDPSTNNYSKLFDFTNTSGGNPFGSLAKGPDGKLYGLTAFKTPDDYGTIFSFDPSSNVFARLYAFEDVNGIHPYGNLLLASNGLFYGLTSQGGNDESGAIFSFNPSSNEVGTLYYFPAFANPYGSLIQDADGKLYGMTSQNGTHNLGTVFSFSIPDTIFTKLGDFDGSNGANPKYGSLIKIGNEPVQPPTKYVKVNIYGGANPYNNAEWNNWNTASSLSSGSLKYSDGTPSLISATLSQQNGISDNGTGYNSTMAPPEVVRYASYSTSNRTLTISGLDNSKNYNLEIYASRKGATNNTSSFTIGSTSIDILTDNNLTNKASFSSLIPISGKISVNISKLNNYNYINGFILTENGSGASNAAPEVDAGTDKTIILPTNWIQMNASAYDIDGIGHYYWTKLSGPSQFSFNSFFVPDAIVSNLVQGTYVFRVTVYDSKGASSYDDVQITVNAAGVTKYVKVNLYGGLNPYNHPEWNNWNSSSSLSSGTLKYSDGTSSSVSAALSQQSGIADNGTGYNSTMAPPEVVRYASYSTSNRTLTISGLDNSKTYDLELYASRKGATSNTTRFTIGATSVDILTDNNLTNKASFTSIAPSGGQIIVSISKLNSYNYLNGFVLTENAISSPITRRLQPSSELQVLSSSINTYPNPATDQIVLSVNNNYTGQMKVQIIDMRGAVVKEFRLSKNYKGVSQNYLQVKDLIRGEYLIRIQSGNNIETKKLLKL